MTTMDTQTLMTTAELLAIPDDGIERELSNGKLRQMGMTRSGRRHTKASIRIGKLLDVWLDSQPKPRGEVLVKVRDYLDVGVPLVRVVETVFKTVTVYQPGEEPQMFTMKQELIAEPHMPGLRIPVARIFE